MYQWQVGYFNGVLKYLLEHLKHKNISCITQAFSRKEYNYIWILQLDYFQWCGHDIGKIPAILSCPGALFPTPELKEMGGVRESCEKGCLV